MDEVIESMQSIVLRDCLETIGNAVNRLSIPVNQVPPNLVQQNFQDNLVLHHLLGNAIGQIEAGLQNNHDIRFYNDFLAVSVVPLPANATLAQLFERLSAYVNVLCRLSIEVETDEEFPANAQENSLLNLGQVVTFAVSEMPRRFHPRNSREAYFLYSTQSKISRIIQQNWDKFTFSNLQDIQSLIVNAIEQLELMLRHSNVRVQDHIRLGKPVLPEEPTFRKLFKRLKNSVHVLCVLVEAEDLKQGPAINEDEKKVITDGRKILDDLTRKILIPTSGNQSDQSSDREVWPF